MAETDLDQQAKSGPTYEELFKRYVTGLAGQLDPIAKEILGAAVARMWHSIDKNEDGQIDDKALRQIFGVGENECKLYKQRLSALNQAFGTGHGYTKY